MKSKVVGKEFIFKQYRIRGKEIQFHYEIVSFKNTSLQFTEKLILPKEITRISKQELDTILRPLSLVLGISYYKLYCPKKIATFFPLSKEQSEFFSNLYKKGLGEFAFKNKLDPKDIGNFPFKKDTDSKFTSPFRVKNRDRSLVGIGGGKDSIVVLELLKSSKICKDITAYKLETGKPSKISNSVIKLSGNSSLKIKRLLDPQIFDNHPDSYNGHIPISAVIAFTGILSAIAYDYKYMVVGNENSSSFGNTKYKGMEINHQWSKSVEFERSFQKYVQKYITPDVKYFSLLRQITELKISQIFSQYPKYFKTFSSCNASYKIHKKRPDTLWCNHCPKCCAIFIMLAPFISQKRLVKIFGENLLNKKELLSTYEELLGLKGFKPFECVGTYEETKLAFLKIRNSYENSYIVKKLKNKVKLNEKKSELVLKPIIMDTVPDHFKFLTLDTACIIGHGLEGQETEVFLKENYPNLRLKILDQKADSNYLEKQHGCDIAIKSSGVNPKLVKIPYTTATNIFFSKNNNFTIGITGTKGKSTVSSLIYKILKEDGRKVSLIGNIGVPILKSLRKKQPADHINVIELSSQVLEDVTNSPDIAVLLDIFPDHLDYHGNFKNYKAAKENIFRFQKNNDMLIRKPYLVKIPIPDKELPLIGNHNKENIKAAISVAEKMKVGKKNIKNALKKFKSLLHRLQIVGTFKGIRFVDDSISTTPESTICAINSVSDVQTIFLGGTDRGYDFSNLKKRIKKLKIKNFVLFPDTGNRIFTKKELTKMNFIKTSSMEEAVKFAYKNTAEGKTCLLSTASPSYSLWKNFEDKGESFEKYVKKLGSS